MSKSIYQQNCEMMSMLTMEELKGINEQLVTLTKSKKVSAKQTTTKTEKKQYPDTIIFLNDKNRFAKFSGSQFYKLKYDCRDNANCTWNSKEKVWVFKDDASYEEFKNTCKSYGNTLKGLSEYDKYMKEYKAKAKAKKSK